MRFIFLGIFVFFFVVAPMYLLNTLVMPELTHLQQAYAGADATVTALTGSTQPVH
jgi:hypothetical protein